jgi:hypothetical protein
MKKEKDIKYDEHKLRWECLLIDINEVRKSPFYIPDNFNCRCIITIGEEGVLGMPMCVPSRTNYMKSVYSMPCFVPKEK